MTETKLYRVYGSGLVEPEKDIDTCIGQIYSAPNRCDVCGECGVPVLEIDFFNVVSFCPQCLRVLADIVEVFHDSELGGDDD